MTTTTARQVPRLSSVSGGRFVNHSAFGRALRRFLTSKQPLALLPGCGWIDGGCLILRDALVQWSEGALQPGATLRSAAGKIYVDHGFAWLDVVRCRIVVDGDGLQDELGLLRKLEVLEFVRPHAVSYEERPELVVGILRDDRISKRLCELLEGRFGRFQPRLLHL